MKARLRSLLRSIQLWGLERRIRRTPLPLQGPSPWDREADRDTAYRAATESLARAYLDHADDRPEAVRQRTLWSGFRRDYSNVPYGEVEEWFGELTIYQIDEAENIVRKIKGLKPIRNAATWTAIDRRAA